VSWLGLTQRERLAGAECTGRAPRGGVRRGGRIASSHRWSLLYAGGAGDGEAAVGRNTWRCGGRKFVRREAQGTARRIRMRQGENV